MTDATSRITPPSVHMNGSSRKDMLKGFTEALDAVRKAQDLLAETAPHPRDYYIQIGGDLAYRVATKQHTARYLALNNIAEEMEALALSVHEQRSPFRENA